MKKKNTTSMDTINKVKNIEYDTDVWSYQESEDKKCRYLLGKKGKNPLICIGVNPSFASPGDMGLDNTMKRLEYFSENRGYDGYIMLNLYPQRATNPEAMDENINPCIVRENLRVFREVFEKGNFTVWAAWGSLIESRSYLKECLSQIVSILEQSNVKWIHYGNLTKKGHPRHPLYLSKQEEEKRFDIHAYLENFPVHKKQMRKILKFYLLKSFAPVCNHTKEISEHNIGYCQGVIKDGTPFEAELWSDGNEENVSIIFEEKKRFNEKIEKSNKSSPKIIGYNNEEIYVDYSVLSIGMLENGQEEKLEVIQKYTEYLQEHGLIEFVSEFENGSCQYLIDVNGNEFVRINICTRGKEKIYARVNLEFKPFIKNDHRFKIV